jgi:hypothetical protein
MPDFSLYILPYFLIAKEPLQTAKFPRRYVKWRMFGRPGSCHLAKGSALEFHGPFTHDGNRIHATWVHPQAMKQVRALDRHHAQRRRMASGASPQA